MTGETVRIDRDDINVIVEGLKEMPHAITQLLIVMRHLSQSLSLLGEMSFVYCQPLISSHLEHLVIFQVCTLQLRVSSSNTACLSITRFQMRSLA